MCDYQELQYTILAVPLTGHGLGQNITTQPKTHRYSDGQRMEVVVPGFAAMEEYAVTVMVENLVGVSSSEPYLLSKLW